MKHLEPILLACVVLAGTAAIAEVKEPAQQNPTKASPQQTQTSSESERGQQVFDQNCSRCHNTPEGFPAHVSGTIARHMRVRAGLSEADYKALLLFLNP